MKTAVAVLVCGLAACGGGDRGGVGTPPDDGVDASLALPGWQLEDIQPASPRTGQTYGLEAYADHIVVVALLEGF